VLAGERSGATLITRIVAATVEDPQPVAGADDPSLPKACDALGYRDRRFVVGRRLVLYPALAPNQRRRITALRVMVGRLCFPESFHRPAKTFVVPVGVAFPA
jgi:hypothetical protein